MLDWFDSHPARYWTVSWSCFALLALAAFSPPVAELIGENPARRVARLAPRWLFLGLIVATFFAFRWPILFVREELNPDEGQLIAGAITLQYDPLFWRSVDGTTHGPLDDYPLVAIRLLRQPIDYFSARLIGCLMVLGGVYLVYRTLAQFFPESLARTGCLPAFCFLAFSTFPDFVHYSSEHMPVFLMALWLCLLASELAEPRGRRAFSIRWLAAGVTLGSAPLAKLQCGPIAAGLLLTGAALDLWGDGVPWGVRLRRQVLLWSAALLIGVVYALALVAAGQWHHAWISYIVQNVIYSESRHFTHSEMVRNFWQFARLGTGFFPLAAGCAAFVAATAWRTVDFPARALQLLALAAVFLGMALFAVLAPGRRYPHYLLLLVMPAGLLAGTLLAAAWESFEPRRTPATRGARTLLLATFAALTLWPQVQSRASVPHPYLGRLRDRAREPADAVAREILRYARPGEALGQWGWMCRYYVLTGLRQATREAHTQRQIQYTPLIAYYRGRYLSDLERNRPPVFIDTVGPGNFVFQDRADAHESFPPLRDFVDRNYRLVADIAGTRVYVRQDRLASLDSARASP